MSYFAMVVVVEADNGQMAHDTVADAGMRPEGACMFVGEPWDVQPGQEDCTFGSLECFDQHPER